MKQIITLFLVLSSFFVNAQTNLKEVFITGNSDFDVYLNVESIKERGSAFENEKYIEFWVKYKYKISKEIYGKIYKNPYILYNVLVDCFHSKSEFIIAVNYTSTGKVIELTEINELKEDSFHDVVPGSVGGKVLDSACKFYNSGK